MYFYVKNKNSGKKVWYKLDFLNKKIGLVKMYQIFKTVIWFCYNQTGILVPVPVLAE